MSQDPSNLQDEDPLPGGNGVPQPDQEAADQTGEQVTEDVGGVQGTAPDEDEAGPAAGVPTTEAATGLAAGSPPDQPAPDAGEIEWAGQVVKKPPTPQA